MRVSAESAVSGQNVVALENLDAYPVGILNTSPCYYLIQNDASLAIENAKRPFDSQILKPHHLTRRHITNLGFAPEGRGCPQMRRLQHWRLHQVTDDAYALAIQDRQRIRGKPNDDGVPRRRRLIRRLQRRKSTWPHDPAALRRCREREADCGKQTEKDQAHRLSPQAWDLLISGPRFNSGKT
ncbi:MAG: hypothetical protein JNM84_11550 [Planctomycetes bacterium]|nr:hypothetical protein [Planctomycetota bacterium]